MAKRPVNLNLLTIRFPITAIASILHRISGFILFLLIPFFLGLLRISLKNPEGFALVHDYLSHPFSKLILLGALLALFYHLLAGIRHLVMDAGIAENLIHARLSAGFVMCLAMVLTGLMGMFIW